MQELTYRYTYIYIKASQAYKLFVVYNRIINDYNNKFKTLS